MMYLITGFAILLSSFSALAIDEGLILQCIISFKQNKAYQNYDPREGHLFDDHVLKIYESAFVSSSSALSTESVLSVFVTKKKDRTFILREEYSSIPLIDDVSINPIFTSALQKLSDDMQEFLPEYLAMVRHDGIVNVTEVFVNCDKDFHKQSSFYMSQQEHFRVIEIR
ncbi:MAG: hypothetical protein H6621_09855 [Halobacteriovoraceae bacterium]|nr:hypothetical protein [Halobacteriovoraceae bacterium]MCB9095361.1 hypothetical protein [Halobacteriovoraceae bacterium]